MTELAPQSQERFWTILHPTRRISSQLQRKAIRRMWKRFVLVCARPRRYSSRLTGTPRAKTTNIIINATAAIDNNAPDAAAGSAEAGVGRLDAGASLGTDAIFETIEVTLNSRSGAPRYLGLPTPRPVFSKSYGPWIVNVFVVLSYIESKSTMFGS